MVSDIKGVSPGTVAHTDGAPRRTSPSAQAQPASGSADVVTLTDLASRLRQLADAVEQMPEVDQEKVAAYRQSIENGTYSIDDRQIAEKLTELEGLLRPRS